MQGVTLDSIGPEGWGYIFCSAGYAVAAVLALFRTPRSNRIRVIVFLSLVSAASAGARVAGLGESLVATLELARSGAWGLFLLSGLNTGHGLTVWIRAHFGPSLLTLTALVCMPLAEMILAPANTSLAGILLPWQIALDILTLFLIENIFRNVNREDEFRAQAIYFCAGLISIYDLLYCTNLITEGLNQPWLNLWRGFVLFAAAPPLVIVSRHRSSRKSEFALSRHAIFHSSVLLGVGFYLLTLSVTSELLHLNEGAVGIIVEIMFLAAGAISLALLLRSTSARARAMVFIGKHFFRLQYDYREVWLKFIRHMATPNSRENLHDRTLRALADAVQCDSGVLWTLQHPIETYVGTALLNVDDVPPMIPADSPLPDFLLRTGWIVDVYQCLVEPGFYGNLTLPRSVEWQDKFWVIIPLIHNAVLEGFITLGAPRSKPQRLNWEELDLMKTVGAQAAGYLAEDRAATELADARRLAEFNRRFAFVVHDIKNVVGQMSLMLRNAERFGDNPEFQRDMLDTASSAVERLRGMLIQLGNKPNFRRVEAQPVDLAALVTGVAERWKRSHGNVSCRIDGPVTVAAVHDKVASILDHIIQNSVDAAGPDGFIELVVSESPADGVVEISDNGCGMSDDFMRNQLFRPFETSKQGGSGLGAFQAMRMAREMGGSLDVDSLPGQGTSIRVRLPKEFPVANASKENMNVG